MSSNDKEDVFYADCYIDGYENFYKDKENKDNKIWWTRKIDRIGKLNISFDRKKYTIYTRTIHTI